MPAVIIPVLTAIGSEFVAAKFVWGAMSWTTIAANAALSAGLSLVAESLQETPAQQASPIASEIQARKQLVRTSAGPRRAIYGEVGRVSGNLLYVAHGTDTGYVHFVIALATHRCQAINDCYLGDDIVGALDGDGNCTEGRFAGFVRIRKYLGTEDQITDPDLAAECPEWGEKNRPAKGICYVYLRLRRDRSVFPQGIPMPRFDIEGKADILDVRTGLTGYTNNAALCTLDYILWKRGFASQLDEVVQSTWIAAANVCDEDVTLPAAAGGGTQKRYTINGSFTVDRGRAEVLDQMRQAMAGAAFYTMGQWYGHAGAADTPVMDISERDLRGPYRIRPRVPDDKIYNAVKGTYTETEFYTETDFPAVTNGTYEAQDGGMRIYKDVKLAFENDPYRAQRLVKIDLERHRQGMVVELPMRIRALKLRPWNIVRLTLAIAGFDNKLFRVLDWKFNLFGGADLVLEEYADAIYTWSSLDATLVDPAPDTTLPNPNTVATPGTPAVVEVKYQTTNSAGVKSRAEMSWAQSTDPFVVDYLPEYRAAAGTWVTLPPTTGLLATLPDIAPGSYEFRLRARNGIGVVSSYSDTRSKEILGLTDAPADVTGMTLTKLGGVAKASWTLHPDLDVRQGGSIVFRHSPATSGAAWVDGIVLDEFGGGAVSGDLPLMTGTYLCKAKDSSTPGNWSANAVSFTLTEGMVTGWTTVATSTQHPTFSGTKTNAVVSSDQLQIDALSAGATGSYAFSAAMDLATVATRRFEADISAVSFDTGDLISSRGLISGWSSVGGAEVNDCDATLYIAITDDDPSGTPTWSAWIPFFVAEFTCRAAKFKLDLVTGSPTNNIAIDTLVVHCKEPA